MVNLRQAALPVNINNRPLELAEEADIANSSQFGRGWASASMNEEGAELLWKSNQAAIAGDTGLAQALRQRGEDTMRRAQAWAPTVQNFTDIQGPGDAVDWALGSAGNIRSSVMPALGGLAGAAVGGVGGFLVGGAPGAAAGATWGGRTGAGLAGYNTMTESNAAQSMMDPTIASTRTPEEIRDVSRMTGAAQGVLEAAVPGAMATSVLKGAGKKAAQELAEQGAKKYIAKKAGKEGAEEFATEFLQNPIGDVGQNYLAGNELTDIDWKGAFNAGMAGFAPGAMMGGVGATADVLHNKVGGAAEKVAGVARDPVGAIADWKYKKAEEAGRKEAQDDIDAMDDEQVIASVLGKKAPSVADPLRDEEREMDDKTLDRTRHEQAMRESLEILKAPAGMYSAAEKEAAARFQAGEISWDKVREILRQGDADRKAQKDSDDLARALGMGDDDLRSLEQQNPETKSSLMRPILADDFGEQEGRDKSQDFVTDDFGNIVAGNTDPYLYSGGSEPRTNSPYEGDKYSWPRGRGYSVFKKSATPEAPFNYDSLQRSAGVANAKNADLTDTGVPEDETKFGFSAALRRVVALQRKWDNEATKENAKRTVKVADVLVNGGYWPKEIVDAAKSVTQKASLLNQAATMLTWMKYGMNDKRQATDQDSAVDVLVAVYGKSAITMLMMAYKTAVNSGLMERNDAKVLEIEKLAVKALSDRENYAKIVMNNMDPVWKAKVKGAEELTNLVSRVRRIASTGGTKVEQRVMEILFPNAENRHEVQKALYDPRISKDAFGTESPTNRLGQEQGETTVGGNKPRAVEDMDGTDWMRQGEAFNEPESDNEFEDRTVDAQGVRYIRNAGGHAFRKSDPKSREALEKAKEANKAPGSRMEEVGVVKAALDKEAADSGEALSKDHRLAVLERTVRRYMKRDVPPRPTTPPANASVLAKNTHKADLAKWESKIERAAKALNKSHVVLKIVAVKEDVVNAELDYEAVRASQLDRKLEDPRNRPEEGVLWVGTKRGAKMLISAPQVLRLAFQNRGTEHQDVGFNGKTKEGDDVLVNFGSAQNIHNALLTSMGDISLMPQFNGEWGFVEVGGKTAQVRDTEGAAGKPGKFAKAGVLPNNFLLMRGVPKLDENGEVSKNDDGEIIWKKPPLYIGDVKNSRRNFSARLSELSAADFDPDDVGLPTRRKQANVWQKIKALRGHVKKMPKGEQKARLQTLLRNMNEIINARREDGKKGDDLLPVAYHKAIARWVNGLGIKVGTIDVADGHHEIEQAVDGLEAYDPEKTIVRGDADKGLATTSNLGMQAQSVVGTTKKLDAAGVKSLSGPVATRKLTLDEEVKAAQMGITGNKKDVAWDLPVHKDVHDMAVAANDGTEDLRMLKAGYETTKVTEAIQSMPIVRAMIRAGYVDHIAIDNNLTGSKFGYMKSFEPDRSTLKKVVVLSPRLFGELDKYLQKILAHEVAHTLEGVVGLGQFKKLGRMAMLARKIDQETKLGKMLKMPLQDNSFNPKSTSFEQELHAQLFAAYVHPDIRPELQQHQELFYRLDKLYGKQAKLLNHLIGGGRSNRADAARRDETPSGEAGLERGGSDAVRGDVREPEQPAGQGVPGVEERKAYWLNALTNFQKERTPHNPKHAAAIHEALAILKADEWDGAAFDAALRKITDNGPLFSKKDRVRAEEELAAASEPTTIPPIDAYEGEFDQDIDYEQEYGFNPEQYEMDLAEFEKANSQAPAPAPAPAPDPAQQLQAYLDQHGSKNVVWSGVAKKALESGNEKQIAGTLAAAKKQFGELSSAGETSADAGATTTASNLVDTAKPPAFAREKEQAKLDGADYVFAPTGVEGSFASRLADAAKAAGKLIDPNGTENIRDKVVYISVPGASRGFTGMGTFLADVRKLLDRGAIIRTDTKERASTPHNAAGEGKLRQMLAFGNYVLTEGKLFDSWQKNLPRVSSKDSRQRTSHETNQTAEQQAKVEAELHRMLGDDIRILFEQMIGKAGEWTKDKTGAAIRLSTHADIMSTGFHEAMHQLFSLLKQHNGVGITKTLERIAMGPVMQGRLRKMLEAHPEAMAQLSDPEEAVAYMFQFWMMDQSGFKLGPEAKTLFQKIKGFFDKIIALLSKTVRDRLTAEKRDAHDAETVEYLMTALADGRMADKTGRTAVVQALAADAEKREVALGHLGEGYTKLFTGIGKYFATAEGLLESYNIPELTKLARMFHQRAGEAMGAKAGYLEEVRYVSNQKEAMINKILANANPDDLEIARAWMSKHPEQGHPSPEINKIVQEVHGFLKNMRGYIEQKNIKRLEDGDWVPIDFRKHYFPRVWDTDALSENKEQFLADLMEHHEAKLKEIAEAESLSVEEVAQALLTRVMNPRSQADLEETTSDLGMTPAATAINRRELTWLNMDVFDKYMSKDLGNILHSYAHNMVQRGEYQSRFGNAGEYLKRLLDSAYLSMLAGDDLLERAETHFADEMLKWDAKKKQAKADGKPFTSRPPTLRQSGEKLFLAENAEGKEKINATLKKLEPAVKSIMAMEGTLGADISPGLRKLQNWITTYQNFRVMAPGLFSSFMDVMGVVREGGEFKDAWDGFVAGIKEAKNVMVDKYDDSAMMRRAELFGTADSGTFVSVMSQHSSSIFMGGKAREWSDKLFKYNGMSGWNRGVRAYATTVAERIILSWKNEGIDTNDKAAVARVERLFGKDFDVSKIKVDADGMLDVSDPANVAAVNRWVHDAVIAPNAAHRPYIMSDPHFQIFSHLKSFAYSQHAVMLKQVAAQARLGNYRPAMVTLLGYAPIAIAAGAVKEMLIPGEEPPWMQGGLDGYLQYGWDRAGVLGIPQMYGANLFDSDPVAAFGPTANQLQDLITVPFGELQVEVPLTDMKLGWRDHRVFEEAFAAAPFGSVLRRAGKNIDNWVAE